jgi:hypothetical protein
MLSCARPSHVSVIALFVQGQLEVAGTGAAGHINSAGGPTGCEAEHAGGAEQSARYFGFLSMSRFDHYRPKFGVALIMLVVALISIAGLFAIEVESPRLSHFPQPPSPETRAAAEGAGARVTPSNPEETRTDKLRQPTVVDKRTAD